VVGDPAYYCRFGFKSIALFGIKHDPPIPDPYVMAYELAPGALFGVTGTCNFYNTFQCQLLVIGFVLVSEWRSR
jgi:putative acetyltransferase